MTIFVTIIAKNKLKNSEKEKFLVGSVDIFQSNTNSDFQESALKEYWRNGDGSWFDTFIQKTLYFLDHHLNQIMELANFWFV